MNRSVFALIAVIAAFGLIFVGKGITGYSISQTCCTGQFCQPADQCTTVYPDVHVPSSGENEAWFAIGGLLILCMAIVVATHNWRF